ncbi:MAG: hypothetical protein D4R64_05535 [Porphyromonadaceae bacterium]|nr:MAG: hypothetical protein D4R64_05535 [Porphyromonadaceae bacterium]
MIWTDYFTLIKVLPGRIVTPRFGTLDFSDPYLPVGKIQTLFDNGFPYLKTTWLEKDTLYPEPPKAVENISGISRELASPVKKPSKKKT